MMSRLLGGAVLTMCFLFSGYAAGQSTASALSSDQFDLIFASDLTLELSPAEPRPGENVEITARSLLLDLESKTLVWFENGREVARAVGRTSIEVTAPSAGSESVVRAVVLEDEVEVGSREVRIRPAEIDLLWEADSYTPPGFPGRALPSAGTHLRFEAKPRFIRTDGSLVPREEIIFMWQRNGYAIPAVSGRGRFKAVVDAPTLFGTDTISVEARTADGSLRGSVSAQIQSREPKLILYERHPLFGTMYHKALGSEASVPSVETTLVAVPYFADAAHPNDPALTWEWRVNGNVIENDESRPSELTLDARGSSGIALIELNLSHIANFFLYSSGSWKLNLLGEEGGLFTDPFTPTE